MSASLRRASTGTAGMHGAARRAPALALLAALALSAGGCRSVYYDLNESLLGRQKRHILSARVEDGRDAQQQAREQFLTTFELFQQVTGFEGGELEGYYQKLQREYDRSEARAAEVRSRIDAIERVAGDLFAEWEGEIGQISRADLRRNSQDQLRDTQAQYQELLRAMRRAEQRMSPVLEAFRDQVLFLKHNLNARAIAALERNVGAIEGDVARLVADMQEAIREAEAFVAGMEH